MGTTFGDNQPKLPSGLLGSYLAESNFRKENWLGKTDPSNPLFAIRNRLSDLRAAVRKFHRFRRRGNKDRLLPFNWAQTGRIVRGSFCIETVREGKSGARRRRTRCASIFERAHGRSVDSYLAWFSELTLPAVARDRRSHQARSLRSHRPARPPAPAR